MAAPAHVPLTPELIKEVTTLLNERHHVHLDPDESFTFNGHLSHSEAYVAATLSNEDETHVVDFEGKCDLEENDIQNPLDATHLLMDFLDEVYTEYFEKDRWLKPDLEWKFYDFKGQKVWFKGRVYNRKLELMADALLAGV